MSARKNAPAMLSAYLITSSDEPSMEVGAVLIDKGNQLVREWNVMNFETGKTTGAVGERLTRLCPDCRVKHSKVGILGHDGDCGSEAVKEEARQVLAHAKNEAS